LGNIVIVFIPNVLTALTMFC